MLVLLAIYLPLLVTCTQDYDYYYDYTLKDQPEPDTELVLLNATFSLTCSAETTDAVVYHRSRAMDLGGVKVVRGPGNTIQVVGAQYSDSGRWSCQTQGVIVEKDVVVSELDQFAVLLAGEVVRNSSVIHLRRDYNQDITCSLVSRGDSMIPLGWLGGSKPLTYPTDTFHSQQDALSYSIVKISSQIILTSKINEISCVSDSKHFNLKIIEEFRPEFTISRDPGFGVPIMEDMTVSLKCSVDSNPASVPVWEHNGVPIQSNLSLSPNLAEITFPRISLEQEGWFQCSTQHKFGNFSSVGYYLGVKPKPRVTESDFVTTSSLLSDQVVLVETHPEVDRGCGDHRLDYSRPKLSPAKQAVSPGEGGSVALTVGVCSNPSADRVIWSGPALLLLPGSNNSRFTAEPLTQSEEGCVQAKLVGGNLSLGDSGLYILVVRNSYHIVEAQIVLDVHRSFNTSAGAQTLWFSNPLINLFLLLFLLF